MAASYCRLSWKDVARLKVDVIPLQSHDPAQSAGGEDQQTEGIDGGLALTTVLLALAAKMRKVSLPISRDAASRALAFAHKGCGFNSPNENQVGDARHVDACHDQVLTAIFGKASLR
jgi:hypothetical protein